MKHYNIQNYIRHKEDIEKRLKHIPKKDWPDYTRDELITMFIPLVENLARKFSTSQQASGVMSILDLLQEGYVGLIKATDKIIWETIMTTVDKNGNTTRKTIEEQEKTLKSFLSKRIKGAIRRGIDINRGSMRIPEHKLNQIRKDFGENKKAVETFFNSVFASIDDTKNGKNALDIPDKEEKYNNALLNSYLISLLKMYLDPREADVLRMSYGLDCERHSATQIANHLGIRGTSSYVRVSQLKKHAIQKLIDNVDRSQVLDFE